MMNFYIKRLILLGCLAVTHQNQQRLNQPKKVEDNSHATTLLKLSNRKRDFLLDGYAKPCKLPMQVMNMIYYFIIDYCQYQGKRLPEDLSGLNLSKVNFTGCYFGYTRLENSHLKGAILENSSCNYALMLSVKLPRANEFERVVWDSDLDKLVSKIYHVFEGITKVYSSLNNAQKATLLQLAHDIAFLPLPKNIEVRSSYSYISLPKKNQVKYLYTYYISKILNLNINGGSKYSGLQIPLEDRANYYDSCKKYCWSTQYKKGKQDEDGFVLHSDFKKYMKEFKDGFTKYKCQAKNDENKELVSKTKEYIIKRIEGLTILYSFIELRKEVVEKSLQVARKLASSYKHGAIALYGHLNFCEAELLKLEESLGSTELKIAYACSMGKNRELFAN